LRGVEDSAAAISAEVMGSADYFSGSDAPIFGELCGIQSHYSQGGALCAGVDGSLKSSNSQQVTER
jgi:hypothetical protein